MDSRFRRTSPGFLKNVVTNNFRRKISKKSFYRPILPSFFATLRCNLKCSYCGLIKSEVDELSTEQTFHLLEKIRPGCQALSITGGEPLVRSDILDILKKVAELDFRPVFFNTNALLLHKNEDILHYVDYLIISLDSINRAKWDGILGVRGAAEIIIKNIENYAKRQKESGFRLIVNPVITSGNIADIYEVIEFCRRNDVFISPVPEDDWTNTNKNLVKNPAYYRLIRDIIDMKRNGHKKIAVTNVFLNQILHFSEHNCLPTLVPRVYPDGFVFYPCTPLENKYGKLQNHKSLNTMLKAAYKSQGYPHCAHKTRKCFMSCFMEPTNMIEKTGVLLWEQIRNFG